MSRYPVVLLALAGALCASGASAQTRATATVRFEIPAALRLRTLETGGTAVTIGSYTELRGAVVLRVNANCAWRLVPVAGANATPVQVRAEVAGASPAEFQPLSSGRPVASGARGREIEVVLDYRVPAGAEPAAVEYQLQLAGG